MSDDRTAGFVAGNRFGYGLRPGEIAVVSKDPRAWLKAQLINPAPQSMPSLQAISDLEETWRLRLLDATQGADPLAKREVQLAHRRSRNQQRREHLALRLRLAMETPNPFAERLARFWTNHFTIAVSGAGGPKGILRAIAVPYENEAIRGNLSGDFATLLTAVQQHPAMLIYLDNARSMGENSTEGKRRNRGMNENLAREILELHTLSVNGAYTQADVEGLAKMLTGWTVARQPGKPGGKNPRRAGSFVFSPGMHEPGAHVLLGKHYDGSGLAQGERALHDLAHHPATARHIATKLVAHFVADTPPPAAVAAIEKVFMESEGNLPALHAALVDLDDAWQTQYRKLKTPEELLVSTVRALGVDAVRQGFPGMFDTLSRLLTTFNQSPFTAPSPAGWPDNADHWGSPDALLKRIEWANRVAEKSPASLDPVKLYAEIMPESDELKQAIGQAESRSQALALLLASPDFQWR